jgi:hypothetical protein
MQPTPMWFELIALVFIVVFLVVYADACKRACTALKERQVVSSSFWRSLSYEPQLLDEVLGKMASDTKVLDVIRRNLRGKDELVIPSLREIVFGMATAHLTLLLVRAPFLNKTWCNAYSSRIQALPETAQLFYSAKSDDLVYVSVVGCGNLTLLLPSVVELGKEELIEWDLTYDGVSPGVISFVREQCLVSHGATLFIAKNFKKM